LTTPFSIAAPESRTSFAAIQSAVSQILKKIKRFGGRPFWVETTHYPMDDNGKVLRPPKPWTAAEVKKGKVYDTSKTASMNVANSVLF
jgi:hypothetical protein